MSHVQPMATTQPSAVLDDKSNASLATPPNPSPGAETPESTEKTTTIDFNEQTNYVPPKVIITIFLACASVDLLALMDQTTLAAALTIVSRSLDASSESAWIAGAYFLTSTSFQLLYGRLSDIWSRKVLLIIAIGIFFLGSLAASLATTSVQLIVFRAFTGVGGGGIMTLAQFIVSDIVPLRERGKYQGILVSETTTMVYKCPNIRLGFSGCGGKWYWPTHRRCVSLKEPRLLVVFHFIVGEAILTE